MSQISQATTTNCSEYRTSIGADTYQRRVLDSGCWLEMNPNSDNNLFYRSLLLTDGGYFQIFNSYGDGDEATHTGARLYFFFPRDQNPGAQQDTFGVSLQTSTKSVTFRLDTNGQIQSVSNGSVTEAAKVVAGDNGGVEIKSLDTLWLDCGFQLGEDPRTDSTRHSIFHDRKGATCSVVNSDIFSYDASSGDVELKFDDKALATYLGTACPNLEVNF